MKKKITSKMILSVALMLLGIASNAQSTWNSQTEQGRAAAPAQTTEESAEMLIGHCDVTSQIYDSDGLSLDHDSRIGAGIVIPKEMIEKYQGGIITAMYVGWDDPESPSTYQCFVRENSFNGEDYTTGSGTVWFGWNKIDLNPVPIQDVDRLCLGFYANIKKNVCSIPWVYPQNQPNSVYLFDGTTDENGNELWYDMHRMEGFKSLAIMLAITDPDGRFNNLVEITRFRSNTVVWRDSEIMAQIGVKNIGSNTISSITVNSSIDDIEMGNTIELEAPIENSLGTTIMVPIYCLGSGTHDIAITEVNGTPIANPIKIQHEMIGVPQELEGVYTSYPLIEMFVSEESDRSVSDYDKYFAPGFRMFRDKYNLVFHHVDDKYMWGDNEGLVQMLELCDNDSSVVFLPSFTVNRSDHMDYLAFLPNAPFHYGTPFPEVVEPMWTALLKEPTFASVDVKANFINNNQGIEIEVSGDVANDVMPNGEELFLTVYVMEKNVLSQDQLKFDNNKKDFYYGEYTHPNIVRDILTPYWGEVLPQTGGEYKMTFSAEVYPEYKRDDLFIVAFLNRNVDNGALRQQVINSDQSTIAYPESVNSIANDANATVVTTDGVIYINNSADVEVYNLAGVQVANENLAKGVYIARQGEVIAKVSVK